MSSPESRQSPNVDRAPQIGVPLIAALTTAVVAFFLTYLSAWVELRQAVVAGTIGCSQPRYLRMVGKAMSEFAQANGHYPDSLGELAKQKDGFHWLFDESEGLGFHDPWMNRFQYEKTKRGYRVFSAHPDGSPSGIELSADIDLNPEGKVRFEPTPAEFLYLSRYSGTLFRVALGASLCAGIACLIATGLRVKRGVALMSVLFSVMVMAVSAVVVSFFLITVYMILEHH